MTETEKQNQNVKAQLSWKWILLLLFAIVVWIFILRGNSENNTKKSSPSPTVNVGNLEVERDTKELSAEAENEIFYRFLVVQKEVGFDVLPKVGEKDRPTPKRDRAIRTVANEYNISTKQTREVISNVEKRRPTDEEIRIFKIYDDKLNEAIDKESEGGAKVDEDKIEKEVAESLGISSERLDLIWIRVFSWQGQQPK